MTAVKKKQPVSIVENYLVQHGIAKSNSKKKAVQRLLKVQPNLKSINYQSPSKYFESTWAAVSKGRGFSRNMSGECFELIMACILIIEGIAPFYMQAEVAFVPDARFDILIYTEEIGPIALSLKTSLRERYKQAELEAISLKSVHRRSETYLITNNETEARQNQRRLDEGVFIGIKKVLIPQSEALDELIQHLKGFTPVLTGVVPIISLPSTGRIVS